MTVTRSKYLTFRSRWSRNYRVHYSGEKEGIIDQWSDLDNWTFDKFSYHLNGWENYTPNTLSASTITALQTLYTNKLYGLEDSIIIREHDDEARWLLMGSNYEPWDSWHIGEARDLYARYLPGPKPLRPVNYCPPPPPLIRIRRITDLNTTLQDLNNINLNS